MRVHAVPPSVAERSERLPGLEVDFEPTLALSASSWTEAALPAGVASAPRLPLRRGGFIEALLGVTADRNVQLVVLLGVADERVAWITELAHAIRCPVLLARPKQHAGDLVVAATSLSDQGMPIVDFGLDLARRIGARLEILHHASGVGEDEPPYRERARAKLEAYAARRGRETDESIPVVVTRGPSTGTAILEFAAERQPWLLVLGSYPRSWLTGALIPSVSEAVCAGSAASVMILPLSGDP
jgi:nucleotide-binding universal stress UspA family protein